jgi:signal transduction histidine kinase
MCFKTVYIFHSIVPSILLVLCNVLNIVVAEEREVSRKKLKEAQTAIDEYEDEILDLRRKVEVLYSHNVFASLC